MNINDSNALSAKLLDSIIGGDFIDDATLVQLCDQLELTDNQIEHITGLDLDDIKHCRGENNG